MKRGLDDSEEPSGKRRKDGKVKIVVDGTVMRAIPDNFGMISGAVRFKENAGQDNTVVMVDFPFEYPHKHLVTHQLATIFNMHSPEEINQYVENMSAPIASILKRCMDYMNVVDGVHTVISYDKWTCMWYGGRESIERLFEINETIDIHSLERMDSSILPCSADTVIKRLERWIDPQFIREFCDDEEDDGDIVFAGGYVLSAFFTDENPGDIDIFVSKCESDNLPLGCTNISTTESTMRFTYRNQNYNVICTEFPHEATTLFDFDCVRAEYNPMTRTVYVTNAFVTCLENRTIMAKDDEPVPTMASYRRVYKYIQRGFSPPENWIYPVNVKPAKKKIKTFYPSDELMQGSLTLKHMKKESRMSYSIEQEGSACMTIPDPACPEYTYKPTIDEDEWIKCPGPNVRGNTEYTMESRFPVIYRKNLDVEVVHQRCFRIDDTGYHVVGDKEHNLVVDQRYRMDVLFVEVCNSKDHNIKTWWVIAHRVI